jgi:HEAT repeat protein
MSTEALVFLKQLVDNSEYAAEAGILNVIGLCDSEDRDVRDGTEYALGAYDTLERILSLRPDLCTDKVVRRIHRLARDPSRPGHAAADAILERLRQTGVEIPAVRQISVEDVETFIERQEVTTLCSVATDLDLDPAARKAAWDGLEAMGELLIACTYGLTHGEVETRRAMALNLRYLADPRSIPLLRAALDDPDEEVRTWAADSLRQLSPHERAT